MVDGSVVALDRVFRALASAPRREMLRKTGLRPHSVTELAACFDMTLAAVSKHVQVLQRAKLISLTPDGRTRWCRVKPEALTLASASIDELRSFWSQRLDGLEQHFTNEHTASSGRSKGQK